MSVVASNILVGGATVTLGVDVGATEEGVVLAREPEYLFIQPEQMTAAVKSFLVSEGWTISFTYLEATLKNLQEGVLGTDGAVEAPGPLTFGGADDPAEHTDFTVYGTAPGGFVRTVSFNRVVAAECGDWTIGRKGAHTLAVKYRALADTETATLGLIGTVTDATS